MGSCLLFSIPAGTLVLALSLVVEPSPLGTGGAIAFAARELTIVDHFVVINGDTWVGIFLNEFKICKSPTLGLVRAQDTSRYGSVLLQQDKVIAFDEKNSESVNNWINSGIYLLDASDVHDWDGNPCSIEEDIIPLWVIQKRLRALRLETEFIDIGILEDYERFCEFMNNNNRNSDKNKR